MSHPPYRSLGSVGEYRAKVLLLTCCYQEALYRPHFHFASALSKTDPPILSKSDPGILT